MKIKATTRRGRILFKRALLEQGNGGKFYAFTNVLTQ
jgi:hypothetical protein